MPQSKQVYVAKYLTYDGVKHKVYGKDEDEAIIKREALRAELIRGESTKGGDMLVKVWAEQWRKTYKLDAINAKSHDMYEQKLRLHILPVIGHLKLKNVKDFHLQKLLNAHAGKSESSVKKIMIVIRAMFRQAKQSRMILFDPSENLTMPKTTKGKRRSITDYEREILLEVAQTHRCGLWVRFLLSTGLRSGEIAPLVWSNIDFIKSTVTVNNAIESGKSVIKGPKTESGRRTIGIPKNIMDDLVVLKSNSICDFVFPQMDGATMKTRTSMSNDWRSFKRSMDIAMGAKVYRNKITESKIAEDLVTYCLRHTFCTDLQNAGVDIAVACYLMGHSDVSVTAKIYTHTSDVSIKAARDKMDEYYQASNPLENNKEKKIERLLDLGYSKVEALGILSALEN